MNKELFERLADAVGNEYTEAVNSRDELINVVITDYDFDANGFGKYDFDGSFEDDLTDECFSYDDLSKKAKLEFRVFLSILNEKIESMYIEN